MNNTYTEEDYWYEMKYCDLTDEQQQILDTINEHDKKVHKK